MAETDIIRDLRAELYSTRNAQKTAQAQCESLKAQLSTAQNQIKLEQSKLSRLQELEETVRNSDRITKSLQKELAACKENQTGLGCQLAEALEKLSKAEESRDRAEAERLRMQRLRDENSRNLLTAQSRIRDMEEELSRMEEAHQAEMNSLTSGVDQDLPPSMSLEHRNSSGGMSAFHELEIERQRAQDLGVALDAVRRERDEALSKLQSLESLKERQDASEVQPLARTDQESSPRTPDPEVVKGLESRIGQLNAVRDKLTQELDLQVEETERLASENSALTQAILNSRKISNAWEAQTNDCLVQMDKLKDMLEESAQWQSATDVMGTIPGQAQEANPQESPDRTLEPGGQANDPNEAVSEDSRLQKELKAKHQAVQQLEKQVLEGKAYAAKLEVYLSGLVAELTRQTSVTEDMTNWSLPTLVKVETQLQEVMKMTVSNTSANPPVS